MPQISDPERGLPASRGRPNNPGDRVGTESRDGVVYARYRARPDTWVSASMQQLGYDKMYGPDTAYGARTGMVLGADGKTLTNPDKIRPGQEYLIPIGTVARPTRETPSPARETPRPVREAPPPARETPRPAPVTAATRPASGVPYRRPRADAMQDRKALDNPPVSRRITTDTDADLGGEPRQFTSPRTTVKCYSPYPIRGEEYADILGIVAHALIQQDYVETKQLRPKRNVHIDDSFYYLPFNNFLINKNLRHLTPKEKAAIRAYRGSRPDIVLDTGLERGFEEIKPDNPRGIAAGIGQVGRVANFFMANNLPYPFGTDYEPKEEIPVGMFWVLAEPVDVYVACKRKRGLIVYHYCLRADWKRLKGKIKFVFALLIAFIWILLKMKNGVPAPGPQPTPPPQLPPGSPILDPITPPPELIPVTPNLRAWVPVRTQNALRSIQADRIEGLAQEDIDIEFEPYVDR